MLACPRHRVAIFKRGILLVGRIVVAAKLQVGELAGGGVVGGVAGLSLGLGIGGSAYQRFQALRNLSCHIVGGAAGSVIIKRDGRRAHGSGGCCGSNGSNRCGGCGGSIGALDPLQSLDAGLHLSLDLGDLGVGSTAGFLNPGILGSDQGIGSGQRQRWRHRASGHTWPRPHGPSCRRFSGH